MIVCFMGTIGSGKSYESAIKIVDNLKLGRTVYSNIDGHDDPECRKWVQELSGLDDYDFETKFHFLDQVKTKRFWEYVKNGSLIFIDEAHNYFNARNWQSEENQQFASWASTCRHYGNDLVLITQHIEKIEKHLRSLIAWTYEYRKITFFGNWGTKGYQIFAFHQDDVSSKPVGSKVRKYNAKFFNTYKSYVSSDIKEMNFMEHHNVLKHPVFLAVPLVLILTLFLFFKSMGNKGSLFSAIATGGDSINQQIVERKTDAKGLKAGQVFEVPVVKSAEKKEPVKPVNVVEPVKSELPKVEPVAVLPVDNGTGRNGSQVKNEYVSGTINGKRVDIDKWGRVRN